METITLSKFIKNKEFFLQEAKKGKIFIYPTDTIYGIGGIWNKKNIKKIANIKKRDPQKHIFSIIAPNYEWIAQNYQKEIEQINVKSQTSKILQGSTISKESLLGKYGQEYHGTTRIFNYKRPGVRIINHQMQSFIAQLGEAFITTSANISGKKTITNPKNIDKTIEEKVDYLIDNGIYKNKASTIIDFVGDKIIER